MKMDKKVFLISVASKYIKWLLSYIQWFHFLVGFIDQIDQNNLKVDLQIINKPIETN